MTSPRRIRSAATATVAATPDETWTVLADHEGMHRWVRGLRVKVLEQGKPEPGGVGTVREARLPGPQPPIVEEIVAYVPGVRLGYVARSGVPLRGYGATVELSEVAGHRTRVTYTVHCDQRVPVVERLVTAAAARVLLRGLLRATEGRDH